MDAVKGRKGDERGGEEEKRSRYPQNGCAVETTLECITVWLIVPHQILPMLIYFIVFPK